MCNKALVPNPSRSAYVASKAALTAWMSCYAMENPHRHIQLVHPGMIDTPAVRHEYGESVVTANSITPDQLVRATLTDESSFFLRVPWFSSFCGSLAWCVFPNWLRHNLPRFLPKTRQAKFTK